MKAFTPDSDERALEACGCESDPSLNDDSFDPFSDAPVPSSSPFDSDPFSDIWGLASAQPDPDQDELLTPLNEAQRAAVLHADGPLLVLAGAGSGKTRVITHRIAYLCLRRRVAPWNILAVTFTNKAAGEMRARLENLMGPAASSCQVSTFHSLGATLLRKEAEKIGLTKSFVIYDDTNTLQLIRRILKEMGLNEDLKAQDVRHRIDQAKNEGKRPEDLPRSGIDRSARYIPEIYRRYEELLRQANALDFGGLILELVCLLKSNSQVLDHYRRRFRYVLVDEFQDTNPIQMELINLLCPKEQANLCAVGDDDQSIYRWRGADPTNILSFESHFPDTHVVKLEQNYRSDGAILDAAYAVISKNKRRTPKRLWTQRPKGQPFQLILAQDERDEGRQIAQEVEHLARKGVSYSDMAVFYRVNAQSRVLEEALRLASVPYRVVHGRAFYEREEIKDAGAYLRLAINPRSDADFLRVVNRPARGIGDSTVQKLQSAAQQMNTSLFEALERMDEIVNLTGAVRKRLSNFLDLVRRLSTEVVLAQDARGAVERMLELSGLIQALTLEKTDEAAERIENLREFIGAAGEFDRLRSEAEATRQELMRQNLSGTSENEVWLSLDMTPLEAFLEQVSLLGDADDETGSGKVSLMTLHAAKGLEFDTVFLTGMEEGIFPHVRALGFGGPAILVDGNEELSEERRLCYVGITRAMKRLIFSLARTRSLFGNFQFNDPSRFLRDIPPELFDFQRPSGSATRPSAPRPAYPTSPSNGFNRQRAPVAPVVRKSGGQYVPDEEPSYAVPQPTRGRFQSAQGSLEGRRACVPDPDFDQRSDFERRHALNVGGSDLPGPGDKVFHGSFGEGLVISKDKPLGPNAVLTVRFPGLGEKRILARFLKKQE